MDGPAPPGNRHRPGTGSTSSSPPGWRRDNPPSRRGWPASAHPSPPAGGRHARQSVGTLGPTTTPGGRTRSDPGPPGEGGPGHGISGHGPARYWRRRRAGRPLWPPRTGRDFVVAPLGFFPPDLDGDDADFPVGRELVVDLEDTPHALRIIVEIVGPAEQAPAAGHGGDVVQV